MPGVDDCDLIDRVIFDGLTQGVIRDESRAAYQRVIDRLAGGGAQAVVLACTEIGLLLAPGQSALPMIDSAEVHAAEAIGIDVGLVGVDRDEPAAPNADPERNR